MHPHPVTSSKPHKTPFFRHAGHGVPEQRPEPREIGQPRRKRSEKERPTNETSWKQATGRLVTL